MQQFRSEFERQKQEAKQRDSEVSLREWRRKREQRVEQFEKSIKESLINQKKFQQKLQEATRKHDETAIKYYDDIIQSEAQNIHETEQLLRSMRAQIKEGVDVDSPDFNEQEQSKVIA